MLSEGSDPPVGGNWFNFDKVFGRVTINSELQKDRIINWLIDFNRRSWSGLPELIASQDAAGGVVILGNLRGIIITSSDRKDSRGICCRMCRMFLLLDSVYLEKQMFSLKQGKYCWPCINRKKKKYLNLTSLFISQIIWI